MTKGNNMNHKREKLFDTCDSEIYFFRWALMHIGSFSERLGGREVQPSKAGERFARFVFIRAL